MHSLQQAEHMCGFVHKGCYMENSSADWKDGNKCTENIIATIFFTSQQSFNIITVNEN